MANVTIKGKAYGLRFDLYAMEQIEAEYGSVKAAFEKLQEGNQIRVTCSMFKAMANSYLSYNDKEETITGKEIKHCDINEIKSIGDAIKAAVAEGSHSEATGGNEADDEVHDIFMDEIEAKNG